MSDPARPTPLPEPDPAERAVSGRVLARVREEIQRAGGAIGFDRYMAIALYEPGLGYYASGRRKFGALGDFVTAPELTPLFGACVAAQLSHWLPDLVPCVWEFGAGSGELAVQVLTELDRLGFEPVQYRIIEVSAELRDRQRATLAARHPAALERVTWLDALPDRIDGIVLANELLDALPARRFALAAGGVVERVVQDAPDAPGTLQLASRPADPAFGAQVRNRLSRAGWPGALPALAYASEIGEQAQAWVTSIAERLGDGVMLLIDYGFPVQEFYHPARATGTLNCHYRHRSHADPLWHPGLCDITTHVDFSAVHQAGAEAGLACIGYGSQASFLLGCGLADRFASSEAGGDPLARVRSAQALQMLVSEAEMGELFKVIALGSSDRLAPLCLAGRDRRESLRS